MVLQIMELKLQIKNKKSNQKSPGTESFNVRVYIVSHFRINDRQVRVNAYRVRVSTVRAFKATVYKIIIVMFY
ncbi:unnamed protein product [Allacma fusca]|uniref:Uncharacterized protein n=1 Tax=Allacma fusca TaxID=39272 RepID=A0A8J2KH96_9HEXA|nr:unnamed protein product [Allacma fusca]